VSVQIQGGSPDSSEEITVVLGDAFDRLWVKQTAGDYVQIGNDVVTLVSPDGLVLWTNAEDTRAGDTVF